MKILYLCPDLGIPLLGRKGASVHVRELAGAFARAGHRITVAAQTLVKTPWDPPAPFEVPHFQVRPAAAVSAAVQAFKEFGETLGSENAFPGELRRILYNQELESEVRRRFENDPPDFIYERASLYATAGVTLAREFGVPLFLELNAPLAVEQSAYRATGFGALAAQAEQWLVTHADAVLVVSSELKRHALGLGCRSDQVHVIPNGVNSALFNTRKNSAGRLAHLNGAPVLGFVGGLRPWHGVEILPKLLARLKREHQGIHLVIAGDGPLRGELEHEFKKRSLETNVTFTGLLLHEEIPDVIRRFDIALAPYPALEHEFYFSPLKLFEYMACGIPVIASRVGQIADVIAHGKTGLMYTPGNLEQLAGHCSQLLRNPDRGRSLGAAAAKVVAGKFTWDRNAERVVALAKELKGRSRTTARGGRKTANRVSKT